MTFDPFAMSEGNTIQESEMSDDMTSYALRQNSDNSTDAAGLAIRMPRTGSFIETRTSFGRNSAVAVTPDLDFSTVKDRVEIGPGFNGLKLDGFNEYVHHDVDISLADPGQMAQKRPDIPWVKSIDDLLDLCELDVTYHQNDFRACGKGMAPLTTRSRASDLLDYRKIFMTRVPGWRLVQVSINPLWVCVHFRYFKENDRAEPPPLHVAIPLFYHDGITPICPSLDFCFSRGGYHVKERVRVRQVIDQTFGVPVVEIETYGPDGQTLWSSSKIAPTPHDLNELQLVTRYLYFTKDDPYWPDAATRLDSIMQLGRGGVLIL